MNDDKSNGKNGFELTYYFYINSIKNCGNFDKIKSCEGTNIALEREKLNTEDTFLK